MELMLADEKQSLTLCGSLRMGKIYRGDSVHYRLLLEQGFPTEGGDYPPRGD